MTVYHTRIGSGPPLLLLHATLSSSRQLRALARLLAERYTVVSVDRRGSGRSVYHDRPVPIDVAVHVADLSDVIAAEALGPAIVVGHSYGGCVALELAARAPRSVSAVFAWEPPYGPVASSEVRAHMAEIGRRTLEARDRGGLSAAALTFMEAVSGPQAVAASSPSARRAVGAAGRSAVADATLGGMDATYLDLIECPVRVATGGASDPMYATIAAGLLERIPRAEHVRFPGQGHMAPVLQPEVVAAAIMAWFAALGGGRSQP